MKKVLLLLLAFAATPAFAQTPTTPAIAAMVCANNTVVPTPVNGQFFYVQCDSNGKLITTAADGTVTSVVVANANGVSATGSNCTGACVLTFTLGAITPTSVNGNTITTGTGTLTLGSVTLNAGAGGTLGSNAFTSTAYAPIASPTFTGIVTIPTPFTLGAISVTSTGTQLNYLSLATGTTGTTSSNIVFSASPTFTGTVTTAAITVSGIIGGGGATGRFGSTGGNNGASLNDTINGVEIGASAFIAFGSTTQISTVDSAFCRVSAGLVSVSTLASSCNALGSINLTNLNATGTITASGSGQLNVAAMTQTSAAQSGTVCYNSGTGAITYDATLGCLTSTMEAKDDWHNISPQEALARVLKMQAGSFTYKKGRGLPDGEQIGLNAQQIETVDTRLVGYRPNGDLAGVRYQQASALYPMAIQALSSEIDDLKALIH